MAASITYESFLADSATVTVKAGVSRRIVVVVHSEFVNITQTGCTLGGASPDFTANIAYGDIATSQNAIFAHVFDIEDSVSAGTSLAATPTFSTTPTSNVQIHVFHVDEVRGGDPAAVTNAAGGSTNLDASITTTTDNAVVIAAVGTGGTLARTTTYGTLQTRLVDTSSDTIATYNLDAGVAGAETIAWTGAATNRVVAVTVELPIGLLAPQEATTGTSSLAISASGTVVKDEEPYAIGSGSLTIIGSGTASKGEPPPPQATGAATIGLSASATVAAGAPWITVVDAVTGVPGLTVTGLDNAVDYEFRVAAVNNVGQGDWSPPATPPPP